MGPLCNETTLRRAQEHVKDAVAKGAVANSTGLGLIASLWTRDLATAWRVAEALPHGSVNINETSNYWDQLAPFGGTGNSGVGRELSQWFLESFTERKLIVFDLGGQDRNDRRAEGGW